MGFFKSLAKDTCKGYDKVKATKKLTYDELFEIIKDGNFPCGTPELTGSGIMRCIKFPPNNKYVIQLSICGASIQATKTYSGAGGLLKEVAGDTLTKGMYSTVNGENIDMNRMTTTVIEEITRLLKEKDLLA